MINIAGASEGRIAPIITEILKEKKGQCLIVVPTLARAKRLETDLSFFSALESETQALPEGEETSAGESTQAPGRGTAEEPGRRILVLPPEDETQMLYEAKSNDSLLERMKVLRAVAGGEDCIVIAPASGAIRKLPPKEIFRENMVELRLGQDIDPAGMAERLSLMGYERTAMIEARGEFSMRGGIIDIFTPEGELPYRIELFDTEIDSIRTFDPDTQRSRDALNSITIYQCTQLVRDREIFDRAAGRIRRAYDRAIKKAAGAGTQSSPGKNGASEAYGRSEKAAAPDRESIVSNLAARRDQLLEFAEGMINLQYMEKFLGYFYDETEYIWDYMDSPTIMVDDPSRILESLDAAGKERTMDMEELLLEGRAIKEEFALYSDESDFFRIYNLPEKYGKEGYIFTPFVMTIRGEPFLSELRQVETRQMPEYAGHMDQLRGDLEGYVARGYDVTIVCSSEERRKNMLEFVDRENFNGRILPGRAKAGTVQVIGGTISAGMELTDRKKCYIWEGDIFSGSRRTKKRSRRAETAGSNVKKIRSFADVEKGDYVVHESHGIGRFTGIEQLIVQGMKQDFLKVEYAGTDMLYMPVDQLGSLQKYIGADGITPKVHKLSGNEWKATKAKAVAAVSDMADELMRVANARRNKAGFAFAEDTVWQKEFEDSFPYTETDDQLRCIEEIKSDMERPFPMDRLLCGDVGFGKTEVAARALFKCVIEGKQAAVLVPTTLLANQHYYTLKDRFEKFPVRVEVLSRFRTAAQQTAIMKALGRGEIDLIIGTHRLLSKDVKFRDLGLLVIDEEQRFGVKHKEKIKQIRENIDVLTLSATPIPRTLHMSLSGMRDMSTIDEPPEDRYPVQTYVMEEDEFLVREVIEKELARGGQVYVLYNKVKTINRVADTISRLVPKASIAVGHGQMKENQLEDVIMDFASGEYDVLVSTTIIESGIDIPNVNTMIILGADSFGLAQLYQLRGRVGRSGRMAYAYLMYHKDKVLSEIAEKRLKAIRDFTEFGSGFKIAMRDLELRGAGNLLGREQSGHMLEIGYELYCKLLDDAIQRSKSSAAWMESPDADADYAEHTEEPAGHTRNGEGTGGSRPAARFTAGRVQAESTAISLQIPGLIPEKYIGDEMLKLQMYKKTAMIENQDDASDLMDEFIDRFGDPPVETQNLIRLAVIRSRARRMGVTEISQEGYKLKFSLLPDVRFGENTVPDLVAAYGGKVGFNGGAGGTAPFIRLTSATYPASQMKPASPNYARNVLKELELFFDVFR